MNSPLSRLARQAESRSEFVASRVAAYQEANGLDDIALAALLGCGQASLVHLRLCFLPRSDHFQEDVQVIANHVHADPVKLAEVLSEA